MNGALIVLSILMVPAVFVGAWGQEKVTDRRALWARRCGTGGAGS